MADVVKLTFNDFQENTYIVYDMTGECVIFDPGCYRRHEEEELTGKIKELGLKPVRLINTHCHLDHVFGNKFVAEHYQLGLEIHEGELPVLQAVPQICMMYGLPPAAPSPDPSRFITVGEVIEFGNTRLETLFTPGHSPASVSFFCRESGFVIAGDVLFYGSIGRTDLPGGDFDTLISSIKTQLLTLPDETMVYPGHGPHTTVAFERENNPFL